MRGSQNAEIRALTEDGIIPAHAGLTAAARRQDNTVWDHPRACGAHERKALADKIEPGSSPRMRGSPPSWTSRRPGSGIIPAHAGLTVSLAATGVPNRDHPRACGAHQILGKQYRMSLGSSPRMRGSQVSMLAKMPTSGIIPAHAGLTLKNPNIDAILSGPHPIFYSVLRVIR